VSDRPPAEPYTRLPNALIAAMPFMGDAELRVCLAIARQTLGYQRQYDRLSFSQFETLTGLSRPSIARAIEDAIEHGYIERIADKNSYSYGLTVKLVDRSASETVKQVYQSTDETVKLVDQFDADIPEPPTPIGKATLPETVKEVYQSEPETVKLLYSQKKEIKERKKGEGVDPALAAQDAAPPSKPSATGTRLTLERLPDEWQTYCAAKRPDLDPASVWENFRDYWIAKPGKDGRKADWAATWRRWVREQRGPPPGMRQNGHGPKPVPAQLRYDEPEIKPRATLKDLERRR
jgi:phage replication O-like protein O